MAGSRNDGAFLAGVVLGAVASATATLLLTPRSGAALRQELRERGQAVLERVQAAGDEVGQLVAERREALGLGAEPAPAGPYSSAMPAPPPADEPLLVVEIGEAPGPETGAASSATPTREG